MNRPRPERSDALVRIVVALVLAGVAVAAFARVWVAVRVGPGWDAYAYLANAAEFAGKGFGYTEPERPPALSWLVAAVFLASEPRREVIQWADLAVSLVGLCAFFALLRRRVGPVAAALGTAALALAPPVWAWMGAGYTDFASVAVALLALICLTRATEINPYYYLLAVPLGMTAVLTRFTALLFLVPLAVWFVLRTRLLRHAPYVAGGIATAVALYVPVSAYYAERFGDRLFPFIISARIAAEQLTGQGFVTTEPGAFPALLVVAVVAAGAVAIAGLAESVVARAAEAPRPPFLRVLSVGALLAAVTTTQISGGFAVRQLVLALAVPVGYLILTGRDAQRLDSRLALDATMLSWATAYGDWLVHNPIQVPRYLIGLLPPLLYFGALGLRAWSERMPGWLGTSPAACSIARGIALGLVALLLTTALLTDIASTPRVPDPASVAAERTAAWLVADDPGIAQRRVFSDVWPYTSWYLRAPASPMPAFEETRAIAHELDKTGADIYVAFGERGLEPTFTAAHAEGGLRVLARREQPDVTRPRVLYLGDAWTNYLERVTDYAFFLDSDNGAQGWEGTAFLDAFDASELASYPVVAAYDFRWRDRAGGEKALSKYIGAGNTLVFDASANFDTAGRSLSDAGMFETAIARKQVAEDAVVTIEPGFLADHPELAALDGRRWDAPGDAPWFGASYEPLAATGGWRVLANAGDVVLVAEQRFGKGRILWLGGNLVWHAFSAEDPDVSSLVGAVFADALKQPTSEEQ